MPAKKKTDAESAKKKDDAESTPQAEDEVEVEYGDDAGETATLLLAAAEELHGDQSLVRTGNGVFIVPKSVADKAKK